MGLFSTLFGTTNTSPQPGRWSSDGMFRVAPGGRTLDVGETAFIRRPGPKKTREDVGGLDPHKAVYVTRIDCQFRETILGATESAMLTYVWFFINPDLATRSADANMRMPHAWVVGEWRGCDAKLPSRYGDEATYYPGAGTFFMVKNRRAVTEAVNATIVNGKIKLDRYDRGRKVPVTKFERTH